MTKSICGEPTGKEKSFIDSLNSISINKLTIEHVPCYPGYIQAHLKTKVARETLEDIETAVTMFGYAEFLVYDKDNVLIMGNAGSM